MVDAVDEEEFDEEEFITEDAPRRPSFRPLVNKQQQQQQRPRADASNDPAASATTAAATTASSKSNNGAAGDAANAKAAADLPPVSFLPHDLTLEYIYGSFLVAYAIWFWLGRRNNQNLAQAWYTIRSRSIHRSIDRSLETAIPINCCVCLSRSLSQVRRVRPDAHDPVPSRDVVEQGEPELVLSLGFWSFVLQGSQGHDRCTMLCSVTFFETALLPI